VSRLPKPDLKLADLRVPAVLVDLFHDLRDRRLLPLVVLVLVALVAVPFLLSSSDGSSSASEPAVPPVASGSVAPDAKLTVVETDHGLREPDKRLGHRTPKDPFHQQYTAPPGGTEQVTQTSTTTSTASSAATTLTTESGTVGSAPVQSTPSTPTESPSGGGGAEDQPLTIFTFAVDLKIVKTVPKQGGGKATSEPETRDRVLPPATLPGKKTQALTYIGISPKDRKPLFMISEDVSSVFGEAECVSGAARCQLVELEPDFPFTVVYGPNEVRYKFTVLDIEPVSTGHS